MDNEASPPGIINRRRRYSAEFNNRVLAPPRCAGRPHTVLARVNQMKMLVCDGFGLWLAARRLHQGKFVSTSMRTGGAVTLDASQLQASVVGLPWQYAAAQHVIDRQ